MWGIESWVDALLVVLVIEALAATVATMSSNGARTEIDPANVDINYTAGLFQGTLFADEVHEAIETGSLTINGFVPEYISVQPVGQDRSGARGQEVVVEIEREGSPITSVSDWRYVQLEVDRDNEFGHWLKVDEWLEVDDGDPDVDPALGTYRAKFRATKHRRESSDPHVGADQ